MVSPHLLRPFSARQLSLVAGDERVVVYAVMGDRWSGASLLVHVPTLARRIAELPGHIDLTVFVDEPVPEPMTVSLVDDMVAAIPRSVDVLARAVPVTEALKRVAGDRVVEAVDRSQLFGLRCPEVIRRSALEAALPIVGDRMWVSPAGLVAEAGGTLSFFEVVASEGSSGPPAGTKGP